MYDTVGMLDAGALRAAFRSGRLGARAGRVAALAPAGVQLEGGGQLPADVVVLATGYRPTAAALLPAQLRGAAGYKGNAQWLYRCAQAGWRLQGPGWRPRRRPVPAALLPEPAPCPAPLPPTTSPLTRLHSPAVPARAATCCRRGWTTWHSSG